MALIPFHEKSTMNRFQITVKTDLLKGMWALQIQKNKAHCQVQLKVCIVVAT